jgi:hypothetical protein
MTKTPHHHHRCATCGLEWREPLWIAGLPLRFVDKRTQPKPWRIRADGNVIVIGFGPALQAKLLNVAWVRDILLLPGVLYGYCLDYGPIEVCAPNLTCLCTDLGDEFMRVGKSIIVSRAACLVPDPSNFVIGLAAGTAGGRPIIHQLRVSRHYRSNVESLLPPYLRSHHAAHDDEVQTPAT